VISRKSQIAKGRPVRIRLRPSELPSPFVAVEPPISAAFVAATPEIEGKARSGSAREHDADELVIE
jgi:hypothetical protein